MDPLWKSRQAVIRDRCPWRSVVRELVRTRADAGVLVKGTHAYGEQFGIVGVVGE
jgi:hypothetical protein